MCTAVTLTLLHDADEELDDRRAIEMDKAKDTAEAVMLKTYNEYWATATQNDKVTTEFTGWLALKAVVRPTALSLRVLRLDYSCVLWGISARDD